MSRVIKSQNVELSLVRPLAATPPVSLVPRHDEEADRLKARIATLESEARKQAAAMDELRAANERDIVASKAEGREQGLKEANDRQAERLALLEDALGRARTELGEKLASMERLAALLARETLDIVLGDPEHRAAAVRKILAEQSGRIEKSAIVGVAVSAEDFPDKDALAYAARRAGLSAAQVSARGDLAPGACEISLRLGKMDVGIAQQWGVLSGMLAELAAPEAAP